MNKCLKCQRVYTDQSLFFCLEDGEKLVPVQPTASESTPTVVVLPRSNSVSNPPRVFETQRKSPLTRYLALAAAGLFILLFSLGAVGFLFLQNKPASEKNLSSKNDAPNNSPIQEPQKPEKSVKSTVNTDQCKLDPTVYEDIAGLSFKAASYQLMDESVGNLEGVAESLKALPENCTMEIGVHTDNVGNPELNKKLSQARAEAIKKELVKLGVKANKLNAVGYGDSQPIEDNSTTAGKARNRRIELKVNSSEITKNESNSGDGIDLTNSKTFAELKNQGVEIIDKNSPEFTKINPLILLVTIGVDGDIFLNDLKIGKVSELGNLENKLNQVFKERERNNVFKEGTNEIEKTVIIKVFARSNPEIFDKILKTVKDAGAAPVKLAVF